MNSLLHLDRWAAVWFAGPVTRVFGPKSNCISVLMYHSISDSPPTSRIPYYDTVTDPETFRRQMRFLREHGFSVVSLPTAARDIAEKRLSSNKTVVITFDDGFRDFYQHAVPALEENGFTATMFLPTGFIGDTRKSFKQTECMTWTEVAELSARGFDFGGHSVTHRKLATLSPRELREELRDCKTEIEERLQKPVTTFACPFAFPQTDKAFVSRYRSTLTEAGYSVAVTTCIGRVAAKDDLLTLKRLPMNRFDDPKLFQAKLKGSYDWVAAVQTTLQHIKSRRGNKVSSSLDRSELASARMG
jgi:peptidoglycan/xylan/chitin deacetylase (PgdA/CDA1 family)